MDIKPLSFFSNLRPQVTLKDTNALQESLATMLLRVTRIILAVATLVAAVAAVPGKHMRLATQKRLYRQLNAAPPVHDAECERSTYDNPARNNGSDPIHEQCF
jgi:hypothetical protein